MTKPIYKVFMFKWTDAWYQLTQDERNSVLARVGESLRNAGAKNTIICDASWSSDQWSMFGIQQYPDLEAVQRHGADLVELEWLRYIDSVTVLGTEYEG